MTDPGADADKRNPGKCLDKILWFNGHPVVTKWFCFAKKENI
jgi:hypothetical protein